MIELSILHTERPGVFLLHIIINFEFGHITLAHLIFNLNILLIRCVLIQPQNDINEML